MRFQLKKYLLTYDDVISFLEYCKQSHDYFVKRRGLCNEYTGTPEFNKEISKRYKECIEMVKFFKRKGEKWTG